MIAFLYTLIRWIYICRVSSPTSSTTTTELVVTTSGQSSSQQTNDDAQNRLGKRKFSLSQYKEHKRLKSNEPNDFSLGDVDMRIQTKVRSILTIIQRIISMKLYPLFSRLRHL